MRGEFGCRAVEMGLGIEGAEMDGRGGEEEVLEAL